MNIYKVKYCRFTIMLTDTYHHEKVSIYSILSAWLYRIISYTYLAHFRLTFVFLNRKFVTESMKISLVRKNSNGYLMT